MLQPYSVYKVFDCKEIDRKIISKYRVGNHKLRIQSGRLDGIALEDRLCKCLESVQTVEHVILNCRFTEQLRIVHGITDVDSITGVLNHSDYVRLSCVLRGGEKIMNLE